MSVIVKNAQEYAKWKNRLLGRGVGRWVAEKLFGKYKDKMDVLRGIDEELRSIALGKDPEFNKFNISIKDALKNAVDAYNKNKYIDAAYYVSVINEILLAIIKTGEDTVKQLGSLGEEYFTENTSDEALEHFTNNEQLQTEAQLLQNIYKGIFGDPLEKAFYKEIKARKAAMGRLINYANTAVTVVLSSFDKMGIARAKGDISSWINEFRTILRVHNTLSIRAKENYETQIKPLVEHAKAANKLDQIGTSALVQNYSNIFSILNKDNNVENKNIEPTIINQPSGAVTEEKRGPGRKTNKETLEQRRDKELEALIKKTRELDEEQLQQLDSAITVSKKSPEDAQAVAEVMNAVVDGQTGQVEDPEGNIVGEVNEETAVVTLRSGRIIEIDNQVAPILLSNMEKSGLVEKPEPIAEEPTQETTNVAPEAVPQVVAPEVKQEPIPEQTPTPPEQVPAPEAKKEPVVEQTKQAPKKRGRPPKNPAAVKPEPKIETKPETKPIEVPVEKKPAEEPKTIEKKPEEKIKAEDVQTESEKPAQIRLSPKATAILRQIKGFKLTPVDEKRLSTYSEEDQQGIAKQFQLFDFNGRPRSEWWSKIEQTGFKPISKSTETAGVSKETVSSEYGLAKAIANKDELEAALAKAADPGKKQDPNNKQYKIIGPNDTIMAIFNAGTIVGEDQFEAIKSLIAKETGRKESKDEDGDIIKPEAKVILLSSNDGANINATYKRLVNKGTPVSAIMLTPNLFKFEMKEPPPEQSEKPIQPTASEFYESLKKASSINHMAMLMIDYSDAISETDPKLSKELFAKAQEIIND